MENKNRGSYCYSYALNIKNEEKDLWEKFIEIMQENNQNKRGALMMSIKLYVKHFEKREEL